MRARIHTAVITVFVSVVLVASISHHLFHDLFTIDIISLSHSYLSKATNPNLSILDQPPSSPSKSLYPNNPTSQSPSNSPSPSPSSSSPHTKPGCGAHLLPARDPPDSILFPDWEVVVVSSLSNLPHPDPTIPSTCLFQDRNTSPADAGGILPFGRRAFYRCVMPLSSRRQRPFLSPALTDSPEKADTCQNQPRMIRWNFVTYESLSTEDDVILFTKGVNSRQGVNLPAANLRCKFADGVTTAVTHSFQEVFRCPHPARPVPDLTRITLEIGPEDGNKRVVPSVAVYEPDRRTLADGAGRSLLCACTVVYNVAKFLKEWVIYHSRIGVEKFVLYDNGSDDDITNVVAHLSRSGYDVTTFLWPWPKTQEAGFSHCATRMNDTCTWMMYVDVDEFIFSPSWRNESQPSKNMLQSLLPNDTTSSKSYSNDTMASLPKIGQVAISCLEFGPSNRRSHPKEGVTQGYTCRTRKEQRHKSIVRLDAVDLSLLNVVHHFDLKVGYKWKKVPLEQVVVNHYKYQAWSEFKNKFRRRVSAYVYDWRDGLNPKSKDRAPGLGSKAIEPEGWAQRFCEVNDTQLRDVGRSWFWLKEPSGDRLAWQDE
ncbi:hypothetical protein MRB53_034188 [Persea americana]|uniref:Uncharacterized protein n=1 Tax=Persea americana TaxID=3435 RepID=A0ACC2KXD5_PERAE|nr:hypothetical protein MRB53_034188 [Persea americana]|eukprot:TRINITY_DN7523_c0_g1_i1.p1 TRINITY_DN7523_c0_g1~~TRINITY_DN7523_c0_g1_i1.p1  ORF type:complete len:596 (+),score=25.55 TRINITY_DN7523_c0_g1_i1:143-1930(+)